jgi:putative SOS response-associated peptidase YedK
MAAHLHYYYRRTDELVAQIHPRMPVILPGEHHAAWLGETEDGNLKELLVAYPADEMRTWEISPRVNSPRNDDRSLWEPVHAESAHATTDALELLR